MNATDFANSLALDLAIEQVGGNIDLPASWQEDADHYLVALLRPGVPDAMLHFSVMRGQEVPFTDWVLNALSIQSRLYVTHPTPVTWCEMTRANLEDVLPTWDSFERDQETLRRFFGEHYEDFLNVE